MLGPRRLHACKQMSASSARPPVRPAARPKPIKRNCRQLNGRSKIDRALLDETNKILAAGGRLDVWPGL